MNMNTITLLTTINWISVILAFVAYFLLGALWYMLLFPKPLRISLGRDPNINPSEAPIYIIGPGVCALVVTITCAILIYALNLTAYADVIQFALIVGIGYLFTNTINIGINPNIPKHFQYGMITGFIIW
jgi:hypothetical protein